MPKLLDSISGPDDLKRLGSEELKQVAEELRQAIVDNLSRTGGHFASNLGAVDLIVALHAVYNVPHDKIVFDVGHQCYAHKMLTGRLAHFPSLRQYGGISGFLRRDESPYDVYGAGHASTSISAAYGFAVARDVIGGDESVVAVIGDAGLTGGLAWEGLNNAGHSGRGITVVLNDNAMSIAANVGALSRYLAKLRTTPWYQGLERKTKDVLMRLPAGEMASRAAGGLLKHGVTNLVAPRQTGVVFEMMGFQYIGPLDGHDLPLLKDVFSQVRRMKGPVLVHLITTKGRGYTPAEDDARRYHAVTPFEPSIGLPENGNSGATYTSVFGDTLVEIAEADPTVVGITAAMPDGTGLTRLSDRFPARCFDVGIAEEHAVCFAAGMAARGCKPVVAIYSTFLQRSFDMIAHDVALQELPVIFALDRAGLVGEDGGTHHGVFDLTYLRCIPDMVVMAPKDGDELKAMLWFAHAHVSGPKASAIAVRYPRGSAAGIDWGKPEQPVELGRAEELLTGDDVTFVAIGSMVRPCLEAAIALRAEGISAGILNARFAKPLDEEAIVAAAQRTGRLALVEENARTGGFGSAVLELLSERGLTAVRTHHVGLPDHFVEHGSQSVLRAECGLTAEAMIEVGRGLAARQG
ncbi:MAG: 1-deoxy-D-xylulose-5-phosphate synthase [Armatimonadetes bacterium]|nr:1-deoxy-D-xylulose-5-phosphate synthase [Armatimonadota bacterium]